MNKRVKAFKEKMENDLCVLRPLLQAAREDVLKYEKQISEVEEALVLVIRLEFPALKWREV